ncbi:MAG TPA: hypothetical protein PLP86_07755, partial [Armatimonadota bacterium]|nr:hypothetical protein [Armatimonadota bacterium]
MCRLTKLVCLSLAALFLIANYGISEKTETTAIETSKGIGTKTVNVIVINIDPVLKTRGNVKLHEYMKWSDP